LARQEIYIASTDELAGKSIVTIGLALKAKEQGRKVGYFKPIGLGSAVSAEGEIIDQDVVIMKQILGLEHDVNILCPVILGRDEFLEEYQRADISKCLREIVESHERASENKDVVLIEGPPNLSIGSFLGLPVPRLVVEFGAKLLLVSHLENDLVADEAIQVRDYCAKWNVSLLGVVLNRIRKEKMARVGRVVKPLLEANGIKVLGLVPENGVLSSLTAGEVYEAIGGEILAGKDGLDNIIETLLVGAMTTESAARYFRKAANELVITGGDRTDIVFAALEAGASAIVLTGNLRPSVKILPRADDLRVPIILVPYDTYTTLRMIQKIVGRIEPRDKRRIDIAKKIFDEHVDWKQIL